MVEKVRYLHTPFQWKERVHSFPGAETRFCPHVLEPREQQQQQPVLRGARRSARACLGIGPGSCIVMRAGCGVVLHRRLAGTATGCCSDWHRGPWHAHGCQHAHAVSDCLLAAARIGLFDLNHGAACRQCLRSRTVSTPPLFIISTAPLPLESCPASPRIQSRKRIQPRETQTRGEPAPAAGWPTTKAIAARASHGAEPSCRYFDSESCHYNACRGPCHAARACCGSPRFKLGARDSSSSEESRLASSNFKPGEF